MAYRQEVDRQRWWGVAVVALVLLVAIIVPNVPARRAAGQPMVGTMPDPPSPGDCVVSMSDPWVHFDNPSPLTEDVFSYPTATLGPCAGPIVGEIVSVTVGARTATQISANDYLTQISPCLIDTIAYTGSIPPVVQTSDRPGILWSPRLNFEYTTIGPGIGQRASGQQWSACVIGAGHGASFVGRLQNVLTDGRLPSSFGSCLTSGDPNDRLEAPCDRPHAAEVLGMTNLGPVWVSAADARQACAVFAGRALRTADPTRGGEIAVQVTASGEGAAVVVRADSEPLANKYLECTAVAPSGTTFNRSLIGVGDAPLPFG